MTGSSLSAEKRTKAEILQNPDADSLLFEILWTKGERADGEKRDTGAQLGDFEGGGAVIHNRKDNIKHGLSPSRLFCDSVKKYDLSQSVKCR